MVHKKLKAAKLYAKLSKCEFHQSKIDYLGYHLLHEGVDIDPPPKAQAILDWALPCTWKQLQSLLGFTNFYRQFIPSFVQITLHFTLSFKDKKGKTSQSLDNF